ncbi:MAG TPA: AI-2E family transporter [Sphingomicrobium sp.]|nr:AI-2E family transporter [Sphingomicrobium sp.]
MQRNAQSKDDARGFVGRALIVITLASCAFLIWHLRFVLVLLFGAVVVGTILRAIAGPFKQWLRFPDSLAVLTAVLVLFALLAGTGWILGAQIVAQTQTLTGSLPRAVETVDQWLAGFGLAGTFQQLLADLRASAGAIVSNVGGWLSSFGTAITHFLLVLFGGIFLAASPNFYRTGVIKLIPPTRRSLVAEAMEDSDQALRLWLKGQLISMTLIGSLIGFGLWMLGIESWLVLGLLAGLLEFIPFAGPVIAAIPGILFALVVSPQLALWTLLLYIGVQQVESYLIQPLVQQYAVHIPPVVLLFSLLAFAMIFGVIGILFAAPLAVVTYILVKRLYVMEALHTDTPIPGDERD